MWKRGGVLASGRLETTGKERILRKNNGKDQLNEGDRIQAGDGKTKKFKKGKKTPHRGGVQKKSELDLTKVKKNSAERNWGKSLEFKTTLRTREGTVPCGQSRPSMKKEKSGNTIPLPKKVRIAGCWQNN